MAFDTVPLEVHACMQVSGTDVNGNGTIDYEEFLAATIHQSKLEKVRMFLSKLLHGRE